MLFRSGTIARCRPSWRASIAKGSAVNAHEFAQAVANEIAKKIRELQIEIPPEGVTAISLDEKSHLAIVVSVTPGDSVRAKTAHLKTKFRVI